MSFSSILAGLQQQFAGAWSNIVGYITSGAQDVGNAVSGTFTDAKDLAISGITSISSALDALSQWTQNQLAAAFEQLGELTQQVEDWLGLTSERARQYLLARIAAAPAGVLSETLQVAHRAGGDLSVPDVNQGAPWAVLEEAAGHLAAWGSDASHPAFVALTEAAADMRASMTGAPPSIPQPAPTPQGTPGFPDLQDPAGADPFAAGLLTDKDSAYVQSTTSAGP